MYERLQCRSRNYVRMVSIGIVAMFAVMVFPCGTSLAATDNLKVYVQVIEAKALDPVDPLGEAPDFYAKVLCTATGYSKELTGSVFDHYSGWFAVFDVPNTITSAAITLKLYDKDLFSSDTCDIGGSGTNYAAMTYTISSRTWTGADYNGDSNGLGRVSGNQDGSTGSDENDCDLYFWISSGVQAPSRYYGYVKTVSGSAISGAEVSFYAWMYDAPGNIWYPGNALWGSDRATHSLGKAYTDSNGYYSFSWTSGITKVLAMAERHLVAGGTTGNYGYWAEKQNISMGTNGVGYGEFRLVSNMTAWVTQLAAFATVDVSHTRVLMDYTTGHTSQTTVSSSCPFQTETKTYTHSVIAYSITPNYQCLSIVREVKVWIVGIYWKDSGGKVLESSAKSYVNPLNFYTTYSVQDAKKYYQVPGYWIETLDPYEGNVKIHKADSGTVSLQWGIDVSYSVGIYGITSVMHLGTSLTDTDSTTQEVTIQIWNDQNKIQDYYFGLDGGCILHCWEKGYGGN